MGEIDIDLPFIASVSLIQFDQCALRALSPSLKTVLMKKGCLAGVAQRESTGAHWSSCTVPK